MNHYSIWLQFQIKFRDSTYMDRIQMCLQVFMPFEFFRTFRTLQCRIIFVFDFVDQQSRLRRECLSTLFAQFITFALQIESFSRKKVIFLSEKMLFSKIARSNYSEICLNAINLHVCQHELLACAMWEIFYHTSDTGIWDGLHVI